MKFNYVLICSDKTPNKATTKMTKSRTRSDVETTAVVRKQKGTKGRKQNTATNKSLQRRERETKFSKFPKFPKFSKFFRL